MAELNSAVGKRVARVDGPAKATGSAKYTADLTLPGMLSEHELTRYARQLVLPGSYLGSEGMAKSGLSGLAWPSVERVG